MKTHKILKRKASIFIFVMLCNLFAQATNLWNGSISTGFASGTGTLTDPYIINSPDQLGYLAKLVNGDYSQYPAIASDPQLGKYFRLNANIDLNGTNFNWKPIGGGSFVGWGDFFSFQGTFDGNGHTISNIKVFTTGNALNCGLFGSVGVNGTVKNIRMVGGSVLSPKFAGAVVGNNNGKVLACINDGVSIGESSGGNWCFSGVVGNNVNGKVTSCLSTGNVTATGGNFGGVGFDETNDRSINVTKCYYYATAQSATSWFNIGTWKNTITSLNDPVVIDDLNAGLTNSSTQFRFKANTDLTKAPVLYNLWNGSISTSFASGIGSTTDPYIINSPDQLAYLARLVNGDNSQYPAIVSDPQLGKYFKLNADIDLNGTNFNWKPIGGGSFVGWGDFFSFQGTFDGNGHTISNIKVFTTGNALNCGLFGSVGVNGTVKNIRMVGGSVLSPKFAGAVVGNNNGKVLACINDGVSVGESSGGNWCFSGVVGNNVNGKVTSCLSTGNVTATGGNFGGVGFDETNNRAINVTKCYYYATAQSATSWFNIGTWKNTITSLNDQVVIDDLNAGLTSSSTQFRFKANTDLTKAPVIYDPNSFFVSKGVNIASWLSFPKYTAGQKRADFFTEYDVIKLKQLGFDHIRLEIDEAELWDISGNPIRAYAFDLLHQAIGWCVSHNMKVIVDMHTTRNHSFLNQENLLFTDSSQPAKFVNLWLSLSNELKNYPNNLVAYELLNEPVSLNAQKWTDVVNLVIPAIRANEAKRTIIVGVCTQNNVVMYNSLTLPTNKDYIDLTFHFYTPYLLTAFGQLDTTDGRTDIAIQYPGQLVPDADIYKLPANWQSTGRQTFNINVLQTDIMKGINRSNQLGVPCYVGEFGTLYTVPEQSRFNWYKDVTTILNLEGVSYASFDYKGAGYSIVDENAQVLYPNIVQLLTNKAVSTPSSFASGDGSLANPYIISTIDHLIYLSNLVNSGQDQLGKYFQLNADLDLNGSIGQRWVSIGGRINMNGKLFQGTFDGNGHTITNIKIRSSSISDSENGLFGKVGANGTIKNLRVTNGDYITPGSTGSIVGTNLGNVVACINEGVNITEDISGRWCFAGIVGNNEASSAKIISCISSATITGSNGAGGVAYSGTVNNSYYIAPTVSSYPSKGIYASTINELNNVSVINSINAGLNDTLTKFRFRASSNPSIEVPVLFIQSGMMPSPSTESFLITDLVKFKLYPNIVKSDLNIEISAIREGEKIMIYDISGSLIRQFNLSSEMQKMDVANLPSGIYLVRLKKSPSVSAKFVKL